LSASELREERFSGEKSNIDYFVSMSDVYFKLIGVMKKNVVPQTSSQSGMIAMSWASTGGGPVHCLTTYSRRTAIHSSTMAEIETGLFPRLIFVELNAARR
jgi:hypothetical protein